MSNGETLEETQAKNKELAKQNKLMKEQLGIVGEIRKTKTDLEKMSKAELQHHILINKRQADALAHNMRMAQAVGDIAGAMEAAEELEKQILEIRNASKMALSSHKHIQDQIATTQAQIVAAGEPITKEDKAHKKALEDQLKQMEENLEVATEHKDKMEELVTSEEDRLEVLEEQVAAVREQNKAYAGMSDDAKKNTEEMTKSFMSLGEHMIGLVNVQDTSLFKFGDMLKSFDNMEEAGESLAVALKQSLLNPANLAATAFAKVGEAMGKMFFALDATSSKFAAATGTGSEYRGSIENIVHAGNEMGVMFEEASKGLQGLLENQIGFTDMSMAARESLALQAGELERIGVASADTADLMNTFAKTMKISAQDSLDLTKNLATMGASIGISSKRMIKDFQGAQKTLAVYGKQSVKVFTNLAAAAKAAGVEMGTLLGVAGKFDTFEDAADSVGKLNALMGANMSATEMLMMTEDKRIESIIQQVQIGGESFAQMDRFKQKAIANAVGITDMAEANKIFGMTMSQYRNYSSTMDNNQSSQEKWKEAIQATVPIQEKIQAMMVEFAPKMDPYISAVASLVEGFLKFLGVINDITFGKFPYLLAGFAALYMAIQLGISISTAYGALMATITALLGTKTAATEADTVAENTGILTKIREVAATIASATWTGIKTVATKVATAATWLFNTAMKATIVFEWAWIAVKKVAMILGGKWILMKYREMAAARAARISAAADAAAQKLANAGTVAGTVIKGPATTATVGLGTASATSAGQIAAMGAAILLAGIGIAIAAVGVALLVLSFKEVGNNAGIAAGAIAMLMIPFLAFIAALTFLVYSGVGEVGALVMLAMGGAVLLMGLGMAAAAMGMAELVKSFKGLGVDGLYAAASIGIVSLTMMAMSASLFAAVPAMIGAAAASGALVPALAALAPVAWAVGGAIFLIGAGFGLMAFGASFLVKSLAHLVRSFAGMDPIHILAISFSMVAMAAAMYIMAAGMAVLIGAAAATGGAMVVAFAGMAVIAGGIWLMGYAIEFLVNKFNELDTNNLQAIATTMSSLASILSEMTGATVTRFIFTLDRIGEFVDTPMTSSFISSLTEELDAMKQTVDADLRQTLDSLVSLSATQTSESIVNDQSERRVEEMITITQTLHNELDISVNIGDAKFVEHVKNVIRNDIDWLSGEMEQTTNNIVVAGG